MIGPIHNSSAYVPGSSGPGHIEPSGRQSSMQGPSGTGATSAAEALMAAVQDVVEALQNVQGGNIQNTHLLQMMIGLLILLALLQGPEGAAESAAKLPELAQAGVGGAGFSLTQTSMTFEYNSTTISGSQAAMDQLLGSSDGSVPTLDEIG